MPTLMRHKHRKPGVNLWWTPARLIALRRAIALSQEDMAATVGVTVTTMSRWERGHTRPGLMAGRTLDKLCKQWVGEKRVPRELVKQNSA